MIQEVSNFMPEEEKIPYTEQQLIRAVCFLADRCDGADKLDGAGFNKVDSDFGKSLATQARAGRRWSANQIEYINKILQKYRVQLLSGRIALPNAAEVAKLLAMKKQEMAAGPVKKVFPKHPRIDLREGYFYIYVPFDDKDKLDKFSGEVWDNFKKSKPGFKSALKWAANEEKEWRVIASEEVITLFCDPKYFPKCEITPAAYALKKAYEQKVAQALKVAEEEDAERRRIYYDVLKTIGLHGKDNPEVAPGIHLFRHQIQAIRLIVWKRRAYICDEMGLGKTYEAVMAAKAFFLYYGYKVIVITTKSTLEMWAEELEFFGVNAQVFTWDTQPEPETINGDYVLICDEAQYAKNTGTNRSKCMQALALHERCKVYIPMTGTPLDNSRPREAYPHLLCCKNPRVWDENPKKIALKKKWYEKTFCGERLEIVGGHYEEQGDGRRVKVGGHLIKKTDGATNLETWNQLFVYKYGAKKAENDKDACILPRRKRDHLKNLPPCTIYPCEAEIEPDDLKLFAKRVQESVDNFEKNLREQLAEFAIEYERKEKKKPAKSELDAKRDEIRNAEAMVMYQAYAQAGAYAKQRWILEEIEKLLEKGEKVVVFTTFKKVAQRIKEELLKKHGRGEGEYGFAEVLDGKTSAKWRRKLVRDFQNPQGNCRVFIGTKAGGEGITLTRACHMFIIDRAVWTPGRIKQWMARIDRAGQERPTSIFWVQIPKYVTEVDSSIDAIIERKERDGNIALFAEEKGIEFFEELEGREEEFVLQALADIKKLALV